MTTYVNTGPERTIFGDETGTDGRCLTDTDLNAISVNATRRSWEFPGYADLLAHDQVDAANRVANGYMDTFWDTGTYSARKLGTYTRDGGLRPVIVTGLETRVSAGFVGTWVYSGDFSPPAQTGACNMLWAYASGNDSFTHDTEATGYKRLDLVVCTLAEANVSSVTRDWEDATTGDITSQSVVPAKKITVTYAVRKGTSSNSGGEALPAVQSGDHILYSARINGDGGGAGVPTVDEVRDCTIPVGPLRKCVIPASRGLFIPDQWLTSTGLTGFKSSVTGSYRKLYMVPPDGVAGNGDSRILGVRVAYKLAAGSALNIGKLVCGTTATFTSLVDVSVRLTCDGTDQETFLDLRWPIGWTAWHDTYPVVWWGPAWGSGGVSKDAWSSNATLALEFKTPVSDAGGNIVYSVEWYTVG